jgi:DNA-directed RNA polymerase omega subunit
LANTDVPIEKLYEKTASMYKLVILASKRALELNNGAPRLIEAGTDKVSQIALQEIMNGKVVYKQVKTDKDEE